MRLSRRLAPYLIAVLSAGCMTANGPKPPAPLATRPAAKPKAQLSPPATGSFVSNGGANVVANNSAGFSGTLMGPKAGLIANHGAGILSNNASGLIANGEAARLRSRYNGSGFRVLALGDLVEAVGGATVTAVDEGGRPLTDSPVTSAPDGTFKLEAIKPSGPVVFLRATYAREGQPVTLMAAVPAPRDMTVPVAVDVASTLVAKKFKEMVRLGVAAGKDFKPEGLRAIAEAIAPAVDEQVAVAAALLPDGTATRVFDSLVSTRTDVAAAVTAAAGSSGLAPLVDKTPVAPSAPSASPSVTASPGASPGPVGSTSPDTVATTAPSAGYQVTTLAGNPAYKAPDGPPGVAAFNGPLGMAMDAAGTMYVADTDNHLIRKIAPDGTTTTVAGTGEPGYLDGPGAQARFEQPTDVAVAADGTLYVADNENDCIRKIAADGTVSTFAGDQGDEGFADGVGTAARFRSPTGVAIAPDGHLYVADTLNHRIRHIDETGEVTTVAGTGTAGKANGAGASATFDRPADIAINASGLAVVADKGNDLLRAITGAGQVSNYLATTFKQPHGLVFDANGNLYVSEYSGQTIRRITPSKTVKLIAGTSRGFADGVATSAIFNSPAGIAIDAAGNLYVADCHNHRIRRISSGDLNPVTTFAGGRVRFADGPGTSALFNQPEGLAVGTDGTVYVADSANYRLRAISPAGGVTTVMGQIFGGAVDAAPNASFRDLKGLAFDATGTLFLTDSGDRTIRKVMPGTTSVVAGSMTATATGNGTSAGFSWPRGLAVAPDGTIYVADGSTHRIRRIAPNGVVSTLAGGSQGFADGVGTAAKFDSPQAIVMDVQGNLLVADTGNHRVRKMTPDGTVTTVAGQADGEADGPVATATFRRPEGLAIAPDGAIILADTGNHRLRRIGPDGTVTTIAGSGRGHADGAPAQARFSEPTSVAVDAQGNIYVSDFGTHVIRKVTP